jgi:HTH-type transcriptional regulator / antitoxin HigA
MEKGIMSATTKLNRKAAPTTFDALIGELMPTAIHDKAAYENAMEMIRRLAVVPVHNEDQTRYLDTLCVLVAAYEKNHGAVGKAKLKPLEVLREFVAEHRMKVRELGALLGVSESAASMILKGDRALTLDHVRKLAERFKVSTALFVG